MGAELPEFASELSAQKSALLRARGVYGCELCSAFIMAICPRMGLPIFVLPSFSLRAGAVTIWLLRRDASGHGHVDARRLAHVDGVDGHAGPDAGRRGNRVSWMWEAMMVAMMLPSASDAADLPSRVARFVVTSASTCGDLDACVWLFPGLAPGRHCRLRRPELRLRRCTMKWNAAQPPHAGFGRHRADFLRHLPAHALEIRLPEALPRSARNRLPATSAVAGAAPGVWEFTMASSASDAVGPSCSCNSCWV